MINNLHQHRVTKAQSQRLEEVLNRARSGETSLPPALHEATIAGIEAQVAELRQELEQYDSWRNRDLTSAASLE